MTSVNKGNAGGLPKQMHLLFENGLFLGAFFCREAAVRLQEARTAAGKPQPSLASYQLVSDVDTKSHGEWTLYDTERRKVWGGAFDCEDSARRWRINAELPACIVPRLMSEIDTGDTEDARP